MKAWIVKERDEFSAAVVFAETRGKARALAQFTECCEDVRFTDIEVRRMPQADKYHKDGKMQLDWCDPRDRLILVKECGFVCNYDWLDYDECPTCSAREYCDQYKDHIAEMEETER